MLRRPRAGAEGEKQLGNFTDRRRGQHFRLGRSEHFRQPSMQERAAVPQRRAAFVRQQVHRDRPALVHLAERARSRHQHVVEEHLGEFGPAVHRLQRADGDAG